MAVRRLHRASSLGNMTGLPTASPIYVDSDSGEIKVVPGASGTTEKTLVDTSTAQTLTNKTINGAVGVQKVTEYLVDGALTIESALAVLTKATAGAYTLAAPTAAQEGTRLTITSRTDAAHVITATNLLHDGVTGGAKDTATFGAFAGASLDLVAVNLLWHVVSKNVVTIAAV